MLHRKVEECDRECKLDCGPHNEETVSCEVVWYIYRDTEQP